MVRHPVLCMASCMLDEVNNLLSQMLILIWVTFQNRFRGAGLIS
jgi:hypothetical protein